MRIVHVMTRFIRGGADENTLLSCNAQASAGHDVILVYGAEYHPEMLSRLHPAVGCICLSSLVRPVRPLSDLRAIRDIRAICRWNRPDIVHTHTSKAGIVGRLGARWAGVPIIVHGVHILAFLNARGWRRALYLAAERLVAPLTDAFVDVSDGMRTACVTHAIGDPGSHVVIPSGMDLRQFTEASPIGPDEFPDLLPPGLSSWDDAEIVLMAAAFEDRKRHIPLIAAFAEVAQARPNATLLLAGEGILQPAIEAAIRAHGLHDRVRIIGFRSDIARWMRRADVCVFTSEQEGLPRVVVQYALAGAPTVATSLPGIDVAVRDGRTGYLVETVPEVAEKLRELLADPARRDSFRRAAAALDFSRWAADSSALDLRRLYDRLYWQRRAHGPLPTSASVVRPLP
ncbi:glycosyltransferase [Devosia sp.]|uniref:glycosyltransferase n=1 Tax=Devosia sp. TaxID=1871048 RepID=UPI003A8DEEB2